MEQNGLEQGSVAEKEPSVDVLINGYDTALAILFGTIQNPSDKQRDKSFELAEILNNKISSEAFEKINLTKEKAGEIYKKNEKNYSYLMAEYMAGVREGLLKEKYDLNKSKEVIDKGRKAAEALFGTEFPNIEFVK